MAAHSGLVNIMSFDKSTITDISSKPMIAWSSCLLLLLCIKPAILVLPQYRNIDQECYLELKCRVTEYCRHPSPETEGNINDSVQSYLVDLEKFLGTASRKHLCFAVTNVTMLHDEVFSIYNEAGKCDMEYGKVPVALPFLTKGINTAWSLVEKYAEVALYQYRGETIPIYDGWFNIDSYILKLHAALFDRIEDLKCAVTLLCFRVCGCRECPSSIPFVGSHISPDFGKHVRYLISELLVEYTEAFPLKEYRLFKSQELSVRWKEDLPNLSRAINSSRDTLIHLLRIGGQVLYAMDGKLPEFSRLLPNPGIGYRGSGRLSLHVLLFLIFSTLVYLSILVRYTY